MPPRELEVLWVTTAAARSLAPERSAQLVADVLERNAVERVVVAQHDPYAHDEVKLLPPLVVCGSVSNVAFGRGQPPGVLVAAPVHAPSRVERLLRLRVRRVVSY